MLILERYGSLSTGMRVGASIRFIRSFDEPVSPRQSDSGNAKTDQQLRFIFRAFGQHNHFSGYGCECSDEHQFDLHDMATQVTGDVLQYFKGDEYGQQIAKNANQTITKPVGILFIGDQRQRNPDRELHDRSRDHNSSDCGEQDGDLLFTCINPLQETSAFATGLNHCDQLLLNGLK